MSKVHFVKFHGTAYTLCSVFAQKYVDPHIIQWGVLSLSTEFLKKIQFSTLPVAYKIIIVIFHYCETFMCIILP